MNRARLRERESGGDSECELNSDLMSPSGAILILCLYVVATKA